MQHTVTVLWAKLSTWMLHWTGWSETAYCGYINTPQRHSQPACTGEIKLSFSAVYVA